MSKSSEHMSSPGFLQLEVRAVLELARQAYAYASRLCVVAFMLTTHHHFPARSNHGQPVSLQYCRHHVLGHAGGAARHPPDQHRPQQQSLADAAPGQHSPAGGVHQRAACHRAARIYGVNPVPNIRHDAVTEKACSPIRWTVQKLSYR
jgi:hypothetical protein